MKLTYLQILFYTSLLFSCNSEKLQKLKKFQTKRILLETDYINSKIEFIDFGTISKEYYYKTKTKIYCLDSNFKKNKTVVIPDTLPRILNYYLKNKDSIFIITEKNKIYLISDDKVYNFPIDQSTIQQCIPNVHQFYINNRNEVFLYSPDGDYSISKCKLSIDKLFAREFCVKRSNDNPFSRFFIGKEGKCYYFFENKLQIFELNGKKYSIECNDYNFKESKYFEQHKHSISEFIKNSTETDALLLIKYDPYNNLIYVVIKKRDDFENEDGTVKKKLYDCDFLLLILDDKFKKIATIEMPKQEYDYCKSFISNQGLCIKKIKTNEIDIFNFK